MKAKQKLLQILFAVAGIAMAAAAIWKLHGIFAEYRAGDDTYAEAADAAVTVQFTPIPLQETETTVEPVLPSAPITVDFSVLSAVRGEVVGWLYGADTALNYPVLQCSNNEYYLDRLPDGTYNKAGSLFLDCDTPQDLSALNSIIYGHHIRGDKMFGALVHYKDPAYFRAHPVVRFDTTERLANYEIFAVFMLDIESPAFNPYASASWASEAAFERYLELVESVRLYDTGKRPTWGDEILTLSTCETDGDFDRILVLAYRTKGE